MTDAWPLVLVGAAAVVIGVAWRAWRERLKAPADPSARQPRIRSSFSDDPIMTSMGLGHGDPSTEDPATSRRP
jgi:hypothetical protein